jgi:hypothetical protein
MHRVARYYQLTQIYPQIYQELHDLLLGLLDCNLTCQA